MSTEQQSETTEEEVVEQKLLTKQERLQALIEVHSFLSDLQKPKSNTLSRLYDDSLGVVAQIANSIVAELRAEAETAEVTRKTATKKETKSK